MGGSVEGFVERMNETALELGMEDSSFANPNGLDDEEHYSTAYDMALLARAAMGRHGPPADGRRPGGGNADQGLVSHGRPGKVSREAAYTEGSSMYLKEGEELTLETLLYGLLLRGRRKSRSHRGSGGPPSRCRPGGSRQ